MVLVNADRRPDFTRLGNARRGISRSQSESQEASPGDLFGAHMKKEQMIAALLDQRSKIDAAIVAVQALQGKRRGRPPGSRKRANVVEMFAPKRKRRAFSTRAKAQKQRMHEADSGSQGK
jgi:hypothetical protein